MRSPIQSVVFLGRAFPPPFLGPSARPLNPVLTRRSAQSRVNRLSVLSAITSTQQRLKLYNRVPNNGLVLYCGTVLTEDGKEKQVPARGPAARVASAAAAVAAGACLLLDWRGR